MTYEEFLIGTDIIETTLQKKFTDGQLEVYYRLLKNIELKRFVSGLEKMLLDRVYTNIPSPAEINQYCNGDKKEDIENKALIAKEKLQNVLGKVSSYESVAFDDPVIHKIIEGLGEWTGINKMDLKELDDFFKFEFVKLYKAYYKTGIGEVKTILLGRHDLANNTYPEKFKIIGDKELCIKWSNKMEQFKIENKKKNEMLEGKLKSIGVFNE